MELEHSAQRVGSVCTCGCSEPIVLVHDGEEEVGEEEEADEEVDDEEESVPAVGAVLCGTGKVGGSVGPARQQHASYRSTTHVREHDVGDWSAGGGWGAG